MAIAYKSMNFAFKVRKVIRYIALYGVARTAIKIRALLHLDADYHMSDELWVNKSCRSANHANRFVAIIGCGNFAYSNIAYYLKSRSSKFLKATLDINASRAISLCKAYDGAFATTDLQMILDDPSIRLVYISSNHASHAEYAIACLAAGKHVHIEKPHVVTHEQLERLLIESRNRPELQVHLGFNRPRSKHFESIKNALASEPGPIMVNWFIAGHEIPENHWYFREEEGGRVLGNLCHWTDLTLQLIGLAKAFPIKVFPVCNVESHSDYCIGLLFADGSVAGITFSAKGHTFEGVREVLQAHRGNTLIRMHDFKETTIDTIEKRKRVRSRHRDHGHKENILNSYDSVRGVRTFGGTDSLYIESTAKLFLGIRDSIDKQTPITIACTQNTD